MRFKKGMPGKDYKTKKGNMDLGLNELRIRTASNVEEWKQYNPQAFDPTNDKSNPDNHGKQTENLLWQEIAKNSQLQQDNYYLRAKLSQIQTILDEYKKYSEK